MVHPPADSRRVGSALAAVVVVLLAGCTFTLGANTATPSPGDTDPAVRPFPTPPVSLTAENAGAYAADYEEAYRHNAILAANQDVTSTSVSCEASRIEPLDDGHRVTVQCGFSWEFEQDGAVGVADGLPYEATYRLTGGLVERVGSTL